MLRSNEPYPQQVYLIKHSLKFRRNCQKQSSYRVNKLAFKKAYVDRHNHLQNIKKPPFARWLLILVGPEGLEPPTSPL